MILKALSKNANGFTSLKDLTWQQWYHFCQLKLARKNFKYGVFAIKR
jgi:hypothetical protein